MTDDPSAPLEIICGRHPLFELSLSEPVPNDLNLFFEKNDDRKPESRLAESGLSNDPSTSFSTKANPSGRLLYEPKLFVANDFLSGGQHSKLKFLTGILLPALE